MKIAPSTKLGSIACWLALGFLVLFGLVASLSFQFQATPAWLKALGGVAFAAGFAGGIVGVVAMVRKEERSLLAWLTFVPALFVAWFALFAE